MKRCPINRFPRHLVPKVRYDHHITLSLSLSLYLSLSLSLYIHLRSTRRSANANVRNDNRARIFPSNKLFGLVYKGRRGPKSFATADRQWKPEVLLFTLSLELLDEALQKKMNIIHNIKPGF
jgi:hypothetical protein